MSILEMVKLMIDTKAIEFMKNQNFLGLEAIDINHRFKHTTNIQLKAAMRKCNSRNIFNLIDYLAAQETDKEKQSILLGFNNWKHRKQMIEECKQKREKRK